MGYFPLFAASCFLSLCAFVVPVQANELHCVDVDQTMQVDLVFNAAAGLDNWTVTPSQMLVSDSDGQALAFFEGSAGVLTSVGHAVVGKVDPNYRGTANPMTPVAGTELGKLDSVILNVDFSYRQQAKVGERVSGQVVFVKKTGERLEQDFDCTHVADGSNLFRKL